MDTNFVCVVFAEPIGPGDRRDIFAEIALQGGSEKILPKRPKDRDARRREAVGAERGKMLKPPVR
jgi:hypothetical protein